MILNPTQNRVTKQTYLDNRLDSAGIIYHDFSNKNVITEFLNSGLLKDKIRRNPVDVSLFNILDDNLISLVEKYNENISGETKRYIGNRFVKYLLRFLSISPDYIDFELTSEDSLFFSLHRDDFVIDIEIFNDDFDELFCAVYKDGIKDESYIGNIDGLMIHINQCFLSK